MASWEWSASATEGAAARSSQDKRTAACPTALLARDPVVVIFIIFCSATRRVKKEYYLLTPNSTLENMRSEFFFGDSVIASPRVGVLSLLQAAS
jgi:hypothetical protein